MAFDIYGNDLRRGHCEVHPNVHQEYPCTICMSESSTRQAEDYAKQAYQEGLSEGYQKGLIDGYNKAIEEKKTCTI